ncbi:MAG: hypothetical protein ACK2T6_02570, partial [Anaerolineae bacterium]
MMSSFERSDSEGAVGASGGAEREDRAAWHGATARDESAARYEPSALDAPDAWGELPAWNEPERLDAALSSWRAGVPAAEVREAFGADAAGLAAAAAALAAGGLAPSAEPDPGFVLGLERAIGNAFDERPVSASRSPFGLPAPNLRHLAAI